jgi:hypothetical protein
VGLLRVDYCTLPLREAARKLPELAINEAPLNACD